MGLSSCRLQVQTSKVRSLGQWVVANCAALPIANAGQYATSHCKPLPLWRYINVRTFKPFNFFKRKNLC